MNHKKSDINRNVTSAAYLRQWTGSALVQVMACPLFDAKPSPERMLTFCQFDPKGQTSVKFESNTKLFIHENTFEIVVY